MQCGFIPHIDSREFQSIQTIGQGAFGRVVKANWRGSTVAVKYILHNQESFWREICALSRINHPNIVKFYGGNNRPSMFLVMEFATRGTLSGRLHGLPLRPYTMTQGIHWARQCAKGLSYLHAMPMLHRDLKPDNLLLFEGNVLKIGDFGLVRDRKAIMTGGVGTIIYMAPELMAHQQYSEKCDVYSWALIMWEILARTRPYQNFHDHHQLMNSVVHGHRPPFLQNCHPALMQLIVACWNPVPQMRHSMNNVVNLTRPFVQQHPH